MKTTVKPTMKSPDLFEPDKNQVFDLKSGERVSYNEFWQSETLFKKPPRYPEISKEARLFAREILQRVNSKSSRIQSNCQYKAQALLEYLIEELQRAV